MSDRDHRKPKTPPKGIAEQLAQPESWDDITEQTTDPMERRAKRAQRPTDRRLEILEEAKDEMKRELGEVKTTVSEIKGEMKVWPKIHEQLETLLKGQGATLHAELDIKRQKTTAEIEDRAARRKMWGEVVTKAMVAIAAVWAVIATILLAKYGLSK